MGRARFKHSDNLLFQLLIGKILREKWHGSSGHINCSGVQFTDYSGTGYMFSHIIVPTLYVCHIILSTLHVFLRYTFTILVWLRYMFATLLCLRYVFVKLVY